MAQQGETSRRQSSKTPEATSSSRGSPWSRAMERQESLTEEEAMWMRTREEQHHDAPSEAPTPAATEVPETPLPLSGMEGSSTPAGRATNLDAEDEDVRIAIMALGAMKHLDGRSGGDPAGGAGGSHHQQQHRAATRQRDGSNASHTAGSSIVSTSSVNSTAISSPISTPLTESITTPDCSVTSQAHFGGGSSSSSVAGASTSSNAGADATQSFKRAATLADLPPDFEFPAIIQDEDGNEVEVDREMMKDADFLNRVSHLPMVRGTLRAYEIGKQKSKIVKYGGDLVESSVKAISRPVVDRLGASLGGKGKEQLDDFACRQLDRLYPPGNAAEKQVMAELDERERTEWAHMDDEERMKRRKAYWALHMEEKEREMVVNELRQRKGKGRAEGSESTLQPQTSLSSSSALASTSAPLTGASATRSSVDDGRAASGRALVEQATKNGTGSRWGSMLVEAGATAGGLSAAMSEESMKSLKYCLQWLQYATAHIEHQITVLRDLIVKLNHGELELTSPAAQNLSQIKGDVVTTIRSVVDVVGRYAGGALPEPARVSVKAFILSLPARWATVNRAPATSSFGGSPASPSFSPAHGTPRSGSNGGPSSTPSASQDLTSAAATAQAANRVLTLAVESLDILRSVTVVVGESLDRADLWVERLRMLGLQRKRQHEHEVTGGAPHSIEAPGGSAPHWESARGLSSYRRGSVGAGSDLSMDTSASTKRRRMRAIEGGAGPVMEEGAHHSQLAGTPIAGAGSAMGAGSTSVAYKSGGVGAGSTNTAASRRRRGVPMASQRSSGGPTQGGGASTPSFEFRRELP